MLSPPPPPASKIIAGGGGFFLRLWIPCVIDERCLISSYNKKQPGRVAQSIGHLTRKSGVLGSIPGLATYFRFSFRFFKKGSCQLLAKVCARSTGKPLRRSKPAQEKCG